MNHRTNVALVLAWFLGLGCATPMLTPRWADDEYLEPPRPEEYPDASAVVLYRARRYLLVAGERLPDWYVIQHHEAIAILTQAGLSHASAGVWVWSSNSEILDIRARTIQPDGTVSEVFPEDIYENTGKFGPKKTQGWVQKVFQFPDVSVGSVIEYVTTTRTEKTLYEDWGRMTSDLPIRHSEVEFRIHERFVYALKVYNTKESIAKVEDGDFRVLLWAMDDIPAHEDEDWKPDWSFTDPWWAYRTKQKLWPSGGYDRLNDWGDARHGAGVRFYLKEKFSDGFDGRVSTAGCKDKRCIVDRVRAWVADETEFSGFNSGSSVRDLAKVMKDGRANSWEKAVLAFHLLREAGVEAKLADMQRRFEGRLDESFPSDHWFNHRIVYVPAQEGLASPIWLDPSCESCALGELPYWSYGGRALVITAWVPTGGYNKVEASFQAVVGKWAGVTYTNTERTIVQIDDEGNAVVGVRHSWRSAAADWFLRRFRDYSEEEMEDAVRGWVRGSSRLANLKDADARVCDDPPTACSMEYQYEIPAHAVVTQDRLVVPLTTFDHDWHPPDDPEKRTVDLVIRTPRAEAEELLIEPPPGWEPFEWPADRKVTSAAARSEVRTTRLGLKLKIRRQLVVKQGRFSPRHAQQIANTLESHHDLREQVVVFRRIVPTQ